MGFPLGSKFGVFSDAEAPVQEFTGRKEKGANLMWCQSPRPCIVLDEAWTITIPPASTY